MEDLKQIIEDCKKFDRKAQEKLYRTFYPALFALCRKFFTDNHEILSALNNGMLKVFKNIHQYDESKGEFFNWTYTIVRNEALTKVRDRKTIENIEIKDKHLAIPDNDSIIKNADLSEIFTYLEVLPPTTRAVCTMFYLEEFSLKEIATTLEMKEGTVKWHLHESRDKLKSVFQKIKQI